MASLNFFFKLAFLGCFVFGVAKGQGLKVGYYKEKCPELEYIVKGITSQVIREDPTLAAPLLRMHFHDCFVRGCDGSVLLDSPNNQSEKYAFPNLSLRGFGIIDLVKAAVEKACPNVVSCADIVALVARDVTFEVMGPCWDVELGRLDGRISILNEALTELIPPSANITTLIQGFQRLGLSVKDLVVLSGSHTIGVSHCSSFNNRLYNFTGRNDVDPTLDPRYIAQLKKKCPPGDQNTIVEMDPKSSVKFDASYYAVVSKRRGLFQSDAALLDNVETRDYLTYQSIRNGPTFFKDFGDSMVNMGRIGVLTGKPGEIRKVCTRVN